MKLVDILITGVIEQYYYKRKHLFFYKELNQIEYQ